MSFTFQVMSFIGQDGQPAPKLKDANLAYEDLELVIFYSFVYYLTYQNILPYNKFALY